LIVEYFAPSRRRVAHAERAAANIRGGVSDDPDREDDAAARSCAARPAR